jgi:Flp pilus assembly protein TadD
VEASGPGPELNADVEGPADRVSLSSIPAEDPGGRRTSGLVAWCVGTMAAVFAAFFPALSGTFLLWDDDRNFLDHDAWRGLSWDHLSWMATTCHGGPYQPLSWLSLGLDHALFGMDARGYHLTNVFLHAIGAVAFFFLALRLLPLAVPALGGRLARPSAAVAAGLFALHPLRVESVAWITERRDVLSGIFFVVTILGYLRHASNPKGDRSAYAVAIVCLLASLLAKASAIVVPFLLLLLDAWPLRRSLRRSVQSVLPFALVAAPFAVVAVWGQATQTGQMRSFGEHGLLERAAQAGYASVFYLLKSALPRNLIPIRELPEPFDPLEARFLVSSLLVAGTTAFLFWRRKSMPAPWTTWAAYLVILAPVSGIAGVGPQLVADRYSYLACMPVALLAAGALFARAPKFSVPVSTVAILVLGALTWRQARLWRDTETLFGRVLEIHPRSYVAHDVLGLALERRGDRLGASQHYAAAIQIAPAHPVPRNNLGRILLDEGRIDDAISEFRASLLARPDYAKGRSNLAVALARAGRLDEAESEFREGVRRNPGDYGTRFNFGVLLATRERFAAAAEELKIALTLEPESREAHRLLAGVYAKLGRADLAREHLDRSRPPRLQ